MFLLSVPRMAQEIVELNHRIADSAAADIGPGEEPEDPASHRRRACRAARHLTRFTLNRSSDTRDVWQAVREIMEDGVSGEEAKEMVQIARDSIDSWLALAQKTREIWQGVASETGASPERLEELAAEEERIKELRVAVERLQTILTGGKPPVDLARLQRGREDMAQGRFKEPEEMHALFQIPQK